MKTPASSNRVPRNWVAPHAGRREQGRGKGELFHMPSRRPETIRQLKIQEMINSCPILEKQRRFTRRVLQSRGTSQRATGSGHGYTVFTPANAERRVNSILPMQFSLGILAYSTFVSTHGFHPVAAVWGARYGNTWAEAEIIYQIGKQVPNRATLTQLLQYTNNNYTQVLYLVTQVGGGANAVKLARLLGAMTLNGANPGNAAQLPPILTAFGGIGHHAVIKGLISVFSPAHANLIPAYIGLSGGPNNAGLLMKLIGHIRNRSKTPHPRGAVRTPPQAAQIMGVIGGTPATMRKITAWFPFFTNQALPGNTNGVAIGWPGINNVRRNHFINRHTAKSFNFGQIKNSNTLWPKPFHAAEVMGRLGMALNNRVGGAANWGVWAPGNLNIGWNTFAGNIVGNGMTAQIGFQVVVGPTYNLTQFYPHPGGGAINFTAQEMYGIQAIV